MTKAIKNRAIHTASALWYCLLTGRDDEGLTDHRVIMTDNGYELSIIIKSIVKECQSSKILFKSLKLAYLSSKHSHHTIFNSLIDTNTHIFSNNKCYQNFVEQGNEKRS